MTIHDQDTHGQHADIDQHDEKTLLATEPVNQTYSGSIEHSDEQSLDQLPASTDPVANPVADHDESSTEKALFADDERTGLQARWAEVQAVFVDDPRDCVQKADGLVSDVVDQLTASFSQARSRLEEQWARGEDASTEDLRVALKRYREFFQRLLTV